MLVCSFAREVRERVRVRVIKVGYGGEQSGKKVNEAFREK
jgi:hypothetical protein